MKKSRKRSRRRRRRRRCKQCDLEPRSASVSLCRVLACVFVCLLACVCVRACMCIPIKRRRRRMRLRYTFDRSYISTARSPSPPLFILVQSGLVHSCGKIVKSGERDRARERYIVRQRQGWRRRQKDGADGGDGVELREDRGRFEVPKGPLGSRLATVVAVAPAVQPAVATRIRPSTCWPSRTNLI